MGIQIIAPGTMTTIQDYGRTGYGEIGIAPSGALDTHAMEIANLLVGNQMGEAVLECTLFGPTIRFTRDNVIAITGAYMKPLLDGRELPMNAAVAVRAGEELVLGLAEYGCRAYIAFAGGLKIADSLGSKSTNMQCALGGFDGRALKSMDEIEFDKPVAAMPDMEYRVYPRRYGMAIPQRIRVVPGPQEDYFTEEGIHTFTTEAYQLTNDSNRMACKLSGPVISGRQAMDIISDGISLGSIQVSTNGQPIIMLTDRQTTGGYAKIGTVISTDIPLLAQCKPGDIINFQPVTLTAAQMLYKKHVREMKKLQKQMKDLEYSVY